MKSPTIPLLPNHRKYCRGTGPLFTDLYELTMAACYHARGMMEEAVFSLYVRDLPMDRRYLVAAGLQDVLAALSEFQFRGDEIAYLRSTGMYEKRFLNYLRSFQFTGTVYGMPEGTVSFPGEPLMEVHAPLIQAQILETYLLNTVGFQTLIASKASRCVAAAEGRPVFDFSMRRTHGFDAALKVARSAYLAGFAGTSNVLAARLYGIPASGTMAHSFVMAFGSEAEAFSAYAKAFPKTAVFLIDTYDTLEGARCACRVARRMAAEGDTLAGVRIDSGDMASLSRKVRRILDDAGLFDVKIFASGNLDERKIAAILSRGGKIDGFGVGTRMGVSADAPYLDIVYKMVRCNNRNVRKLSPGKITLAGEKQVFRRVGKSGKYIGDVIRLRQEPHGSGEPLLRKMMEKGKPLEPVADLERTRQQLRESLAKFPSACRSLKGSVPYPVRISRGLRKLQESAGP